MGLVLRPVIGKGWGHIWKIHGHPDPHQQGQLYCTTQVRCRACFSGEGRCQLSHLIQVERCEGRGRLFLAITATWQIKGERPFRPIS